MKKQFPLYIAGWAACLALFNVCAFLAGGPEAHLRVHMRTFWIAYTLISIAFAGQLLCAYHAFKESNAKKTFYRISLVTTSYSALVASLVVGSLCMVFAPIPYWVSGVACCIVLAASVLSVVKAQGAVTEVERVDDKIKAQTFFIKALAIDANTLTSKASTEETKAICKKVYEAIRYSDPMSVSALSSVETEITKAFSHLSDAVCANDAEAIAKCADDVLILVKDRNEKCKLLK